MTEYLSEEIRLVFAPSAACSCLSWLSVEAWLHLDLSGLLVPLSVAPSRSVGSVGQMPDQRVQAVLEGQTVLLQPAKSEWHRYFAA